MFTISPLTYTSGRPFFNMMMPYLRVSSHPPRDLILLLLLISGLHPNPGPPAPFNQFFNFLQLNINGIQKSSSELSSFLIEHNIKVACLQESKLSQKSKTPFFPGYAHVRRDRPVGGGGGLVTLIHNSISFTNINTSHFYTQDNKTELLAICVDVGDTKIDIFNIYTPPASATPNYTPDYAFLLKLSDKDCMFLGDFNAHHDDWFSTRSDSRGDLLAESVENSNLYILNNASHTRLPHAANQCPSSPDVTLVPAHLVSSLDWVTLTTLNSDHLPIIVSLVINAKPVRFNRTFINFHKADWAGYIREIETNLVSAPPISSCAEGEKYLRNILLNASKHNIPSGFRKDFVPGLPASAKDLICQRDALRERDPCDPDISRINNCISESIRSHKRQKWIDKLNSSSYQDSPNKFWPLIKSLSGKSSRPPPNQPISFKNKPSTKAKSIANGFCRQFTSTVPYKSNRRTRQVLRKLRSKHVLNKDQNPFSVEEVERAIVVSKSSTATGPDGLTAIHLKHLGLRDLTYLTGLFNFSVNNAEIPVIWKRAVIIPILKPGKSADQGLSYRPISLLSPIVKILERLIKPDVVAALPKHKDQHAYTPLHSTVTALLPIATQIAIGFNDNKPARRTAVAALDISKAFDSVDHTLFIEEICNSVLNSNLIRWISAYLRGRTASCNYNGQTSQLRNVKSGFPQGSVLSPDLWNFFISDSPDVAEVQSSYADDNHLVESDADLVELSAKLQNSVSASSDWSDRKNLVLAPAKSQITLFTPDAKQFNAHPKVYIDGQLIPLNKNPKWLGVWWDTQFTGNVNCSEYKKKGNQRLHIMRAVGNNLWGYDKKTLALTYNTLIKPSFSHCAPVWAPNAKSTNIKGLQTVQNRGLRIITGCHMAASEDHLHSEVEILPVQDHLDMICRQFLVSAMRPAHPSHEVVRRPPGPRKNKNGRPMKETLSSKYGESIEQFLQNGIMSEVTYKRAIKTIHTQAVSAAKAKQKVNPLLERHPPAVSASESSLPRPFQTTMSQLRSTYCSDLKSYQLKIRKIIDDQCPSCLTSSQSVLHLFSCPAYPTSLSPKDLWSNPVAVANFLVTLPEFHHLPPLDPPVPPPPPEPPP